jgi:hypothetical protein
MLSADLFYLFGHTEKVLMCSECSEFSELLRGFNDPSCHFKHVTTCNAAISVTQDLNTFGSILFKG